MKKIGALWSNKSKDGRKYLSGDVEIIAGIKTKVVIFANDRKEKPKSPDFVIYLGNDEPKTVKIEDKGLFLD